MRVSTLTFTNTALNNFNRNNMQLSKVQTQFSLDKRITKPSDDPIASTRLAQLRRGQAMIDQYQTNISRLSSNLSLQESHVDASSNTLSAMMDKIREANNAQHGAADMAGFATELQAMLESLVAQLNSRDVDGNYLFGGTQSQQPPVVQNLLGQWSYQGNNEQMSAVVGQDDTMRITTPLAQAFGSNMDALNQLQQLIHKMNDPTLSPGDYADELSQLLGGLQGNYDGVAAIYTDLGVRQNHLSLLSEVHSDYDLANQEVIEQLQGLDYADAYLRLMSYTTANQAGYKSFLQISQLSLFKLG